MASKISVAAVQIAATLPGVNVQVGVVVDSVLVGVVVVPTISQLPASDAVALVNAINAAALTSRGRRIYAASDVGSGGSGWVTLQACVDDLANQWLSLQMADDTPDMNLTSSFKYFDFERNVGASYTEQQLATTLSSIVKAARKI